MIYDEGLTAVFDEVGWEGLVCREATAAATAECSASCLATL